MRSLFFGLLVSAFSAWDASRASAIHSITFTSAEREQGGVGAGAKVEPLLSLKGLKSTVYVAEMSPNDNLIVTSADAGADSVVQLWDLKTGKPLLKLSVGMFGIQVAGFSADSSKIIGGGADGSAYVWDATTGRQLAKVA